MAVVALIAMVSTAQAGPGTIGYQGSLLSARGTPVADGPHRMLFAAYDHATEGTLRWSEEKTDVVVTNGLFSVILGEDQPLNPLFKSYPNVWLEVAVDLDHSGSFEAGETYSPRQKLAGAAWASNADMVDSLHARDFQRRVTDAAPAGSYIRAINEDGTVVTAVDQVGAGGSAWSLNGNSAVTSGTHFLGTTSDVALDLRTSSARALRLQPGAVPSIIAGHECNSIAPGVEGATIAGGGSADDGSGQPAPNRVTDNFGTIGGGLMNQAGNADGYPATREYATIAGGAFNTASGQYSFVGGGRQNSASGGYSSALGGIDNAVSGAFATVAGGRGNEAAGNFSFVAGRSAKADHNGAFVWSDSSSSDFHSTANDQFCVQARGGVDFETNGAGARIDGHTVWHDGNASHDHWGEHWTGTTTGLTLSGGDTGLVSSGSIYGVYGDGEIGVYGESTISAGIGVKGITPNSIGVSGMGRTGVYASGWWRGVYATSDHTGIEASGSTYAADFSGNVTIRGGYLNVADYCHVGGNLTVDGTKSAAVNTTDYGRRALYALESPGNWFEDFGSGRLENGEAVVALDPVFAQTINATTATYHVFLTPLGDSALYVAEKGPASFTVLAVGGGMSNIAFDYRIVARRRGYENVRLAAVDLPAAR
jgi:hypothetical protein